ncbi:MAG: hypothetical protein II077_13115 [Treponema sp.]|nr:hypothetical protein [Treponema sp.]
MDFFRIAEALCSSACCHPAIHGSVLLGKLADKAGSRNEVSSDPASATYKEYWQAG